MSGILLTGGTGFLGRHLRDALPSYPVILLSRTKPEALDNERWLYADMAEPIGPERLEGGEVLCHLAYSMSDGSKNVTYNRNLLNAVNACPGVRRVILVSSLAVYGANGVRVVDEESPCRPLEEYPKIKLACEMLWRDGLREDCALTVIRPGTVIGPGGEALMVMAWHAVHRPFIGVVKRSLLYHHPVHYVAVSNVAAAIRFCLERRQVSHQETFIVSDDHRPENKSYAAMQDAVRSICGKRPLPRLPVPRRALRILGRVIGQPLLGFEQVFSSRKLHDAGFEDVVALRDEVQRVVRSFE